MADAKNPYAQVIIDQLGSQIDLGTTLATAIIGGLVALLTQIALHNSARSGRPLILRSRWLIVAVFTTELLSLVASYVARGMVTGVTPILMQLPESAWSGKDGALGFTNVVYDHSKLLATAMQIEATCLFLGVVSICWFAWANRHLA
jgi:hypothetical protein